MPMNCKSLVGAIIVLAACTPVDADSAAGYSLGHIGPVKFRVPDGAMASGMSSDVNAWLKPDAVEEPNTYARPIAAFDLRLWLPDVSYLHPDGDKADEAHLLLVSISNFDYEANPNGPAGGFRNTINARDDIDYPFNRLPDFLGMEHWRSSRFPKANSRNDIFYSRQSGVLIQCSGDSLKTGVLDYGLCEQIFNIPEIRVRVGMSYDRDWLPNWKANQEKVRALILSFRSTKDAKPAD
jgi:hypothetical protein